MVLALRSALLALLAAGCWTNLAQVPYPIHLPAGRAQRIHLSFENLSALPLDASGELHRRLQEKGFVLVDAAEAADLRLAVTVRGADWTPDHRREAGSGSYSGGGGGFFPGGRVHGRGGGGGNSDAAFILLAVFAVVLIAVVAVEASQPKEWLTGWVEVLVKHRDSPAVESAQIQLKFSCVSDRPGTYASARSEIASKIVGFFH